MDNSIEKGAQYIVNLPGSWLHGKLVVVTSDLCESCEEDGILGYMVQVPGEGISHVTADELLEAKP
jgi:hypothetical protein